MSEQSEGWDEAIKLPLLKTGFHGGYPYDVPMPAYPWGPYTEDWFEVVTAWGYRCPARPSETWEDGLNWVIDDPRLGKTRIPKHQIAGWRRLEESERK